MPTDVASAPIGEIQAIPAGDSVQIPVEFDLNGTPRIIRVELKNDRGVFTVPFQLEAYELIQPANMMTMPEYEAHEGKTDSVSFTE